MIEIELDDSQLNGGCGVEFDVDHEKSLQILAEENETLSDKYSNLYAYALKIKDNNDDPNGMLIMQRILEDFIKEAETQFKKSGYRYERVIGLQMFSRRLSQINNDKF